MAWTGEGGRSRFAIARLRNRSEDGVELELDVPVDVDQTLWLIFENGTEHPGAVRDCQGGHESYGVSVRFLADDTSSEQVSPSATHMKWIKPPNEVLCTQASLRNATAGRLRVQTDEPLSASGVVLLATRSFQCLGAVTDCVEQEGRWAVEVEVLGQVYSRPGSESS